MLTNFLPILWLIVIVAMVVLEAVTYQLVAIWFALGGIFALFAAVAGLWGFQGQLTLFAVVSLLALIATRPLIRKVLKVKKTPTNADQIIGQEAVVVQAISPLKKGRVHVSGLDWSAAAEEEIPVDAVVEILAIEGVTVRVRRK